MKFAIVFLALVAVSVAAPAALLKHEELHNENSYTVEYALDDGTVVREQGVKVQRPTGDVWHRSGSYRWVSPEGLNFEVTYTADEGGFQAQGDHLPKAPEVQQLPQ